MQFLADVNIPQSVISELERNRHNVVDIKNINRLATDTEVIQIGKLEKRIILTLDKDFIALTQFPKYQAPTIVIRLINQTPNNIRKYLTELLRNQKKTILGKSLTILKDKSAESFPYPHGTGKSGNIS